MRAGKLRHRVVIQSKGASRDTYGAEVVTWSTTATVWASVEPLTGREYMDAQQTQAEVSTRIRVRYRSDVTYVPEMRATWDGHTYDIVSVLEVNSAHREVQLMCREVT